MHILFWINYLERRIKHMDWYSKYSSFQTSLIRGWGIRADQTFVHVVHLGGIKKKMKNQVKNGAFHISLNFYFIGIPLYNSENLYNLHSQMRWKLKQTVRFVVIDWKGILCFLVVLFRWRHRLRYISKIHILYIKNYVRPINI